MSKQILISISEKNSWGILPQEDHANPSKMALLVDRTKLYAARLAVLISNYVQALEPEIEICAMTNSEQIQKIRLTFGGDWTDADIQSIIVSIKDFSIKIWNQPLSENLFELNKIERKPVKSIKRLLEVDQAKLPSYAYWDSI
jgi:hypothetical protein